MYFCLSFQSALEPIKKRVACDLNMLMLSNYPYYFIAFIFLFPSSMFPSFSLYCFVDDDVLSGKVIFLPACVVCMFFSCGACWGTEAGCSVYPVDQSAYGGVAPCRPVFAHCASGEALSSGHPSSGCVADVGGVSL